MTAPGRDQPRYLLPPRPAFLDWLWAGAGAGLVFGLAELAAALPGGSALDPRLAALILGVDSALVALASLLVGAILRASSVRLSRSGLVGAVVGPLLFAAIAGRVWTTLTAGGLPDLITFAGLMTAALCAIAAGLAASRLADALERSGVVCAAIYVWGAVSLSLAASERLAHEVPFSGYVAALSALALVLSAAGVVWLGVEIAQRRAGRPARTFGGLLLWLALISCGAAASPTWLPWLFYDREAPKTPTGPPNILIAAFPESALPESNGLGASHPLEPAMALPTLEQFVREGSTYEVRLETLDNGARALLTDTRAGAVVGQLFGAGYATAAILSGDAVPGELAAAEVDANPGARALLQDRLAWLGAAPLLTGPALPAVRTLGLDTETRDADRLAERAKVWLLDWRTERAGVPFFLFVDFRNAATPPRGDSLLERSDARFGDVLEHLRTLDVEDSTLVVALSEGGPQTGVRERISRIVVRAPASWPRRVQWPEVYRVADGEIGDFLLEAGRSDGTSPVALPGSSEVP